MNFRPNYLYACISMTLVLFLSGVFASIIIQSQQLVRLFKEKVMLIVELEKGFANNEIKDLQRSIADKPYVKPFTVEYVSKAAAAAIMQEDFGTDVNLSEFNLVNPLYDIITFHVRSEYMNPPSLENIKLELVADHRVSDVSYEGQVAATISGYWNRVGWIGLGVSLILVAVAVFLIIYAVRQALYADRFLIKNMHLVGATPGFIQRPYAVQSIIGGILSAVVAGAGLLLLRWWLMARIPGMAELFTLSGWVFIFLMMLFFGVAVAVGSTWFTVKQYLKSDVNELYA